MLEYFETERRRTLDHAGAIRSAFLEEVGTKEAFRVQNWDWVSTKAMLSLSKGQLWRFIAG
jgi:hypothetical protein